VAAIKGYPSLLSRRRSCYNVPDDPHLAMIPARFGGERQ
jgi:hypothetical protein